MRRTKIIATIGPASSAQTMIEKLILAGVDVFRINCSHGSEEERIQIIQRIKSVSHKISQPVAILIDLQGPKIRIGELETKFLTLQDNQEIILDTNTAPGNAERIGVNLPSLQGIADIGSKILLDDGKIQLQVVRLVENKIVARVEHGGKLMPRKGINFPDHELKISSMTEKDQRDLKIGLENDIDIVAVSFVQTSDDISRVRSKILEFSPHLADIPIIAKIERPQALEHLQAILDVADGVMVARGDLAIEISPENVPVAQKEILHAANLRGKYTIIATQMLESMISCPTPTRAEASDVANAIFDSTDAVLLSGETAIGKFPETVITMMTSIICKAEDHISRWSRWQGSSIQEAKDDDAFFITQAAKDLAFDRNVSAICVFTKSGRTATLMSKARPPVPILAFTPAENIYRRLSMVWGVHPYLIDNADSIEEMLSIINHRLLQSQRFNIGEQVVVVCGFPIAKYRPANLTMLHTIESP